MILAIDIGNSNIVLGCIDGENILFRERISTDQSATDLQYASHIKMSLDMHNIKKEIIDGAIISSVVPSVTNTVKTAIKKYFGL